MEKNYTIQAESDYFVTSDGVSLHYYQKGYGSPLIVIPGWGGTAETFYNNLDDLSKKHTVYILEQRGHGKSESPNHGYRLSRLAKDVYEFYESLSVDKAHWMAHSMGCSVLWMYIDLFGQDTIEKLILIDQPPSLLANPEHTEDQAKEYAGRPIDPWNLYNAFHCSWNEGLKVFNSYYPQNPKLENPEMTDLLKKTLYGENPKFLAKLLMDHLNQDWRDIIPRITVPTLYIAGEVSHATTIESSTWIMESIPDCRLVLFGKEEYGTHCMFINAYDRFNKVVLDFLLPERQE